MKHNLVLICVENIDRSCPLKIPKVYLGVGLYKMLIKKNRDEKKKKVNIAF